ncbi:TerD family protein [Waterburya agarophytonicola K14]|uniref:TerD family protein n=1 Tax=Waterburya agarophytonicola KI4 TaxID=2874699 RepID=A0A964BNL8_9CYAN|nr:TerD family protein [Waterburya agarophytonicola]MCC0176409.1 TerD family protein [Waterburya agarophytonicola KI4]
MAINLKKGQRISLTKEDPSLKQIMCGLGWDVAPKSGGFFGNNKQFDLDSSVICLDADKKLTDVKNIIYFGNLRHSSSAISHQGDNLTGAGEGDDEVINIDLPLIPSNIVYLVLAINIYKCQERKQDFSMVNNAFVRLVNRTTNQELARYDLSGTEYQGMTGMILADVYRHNDEWKMAAVGNGFKVATLADIAKIYT